MYICLLRKGDFSVLILLAVTAAILFTVCCVLAVMLVMYRRKTEKEKRDTSLFLSTVAHDLRSPLAGIKGFADALQSGAMEGEKKEQALAVISLEASRLASITERLCENDEIIVGKYSVFGICELLRGIFLSLERKALAKGVTPVFSFDDEDEIYVRAHKDLVHEALYNICDNAIKYSIGGSVSVSVNVSGEHCTISVSNDAEKSSFSDYFTAGARGNTSEKGSGLGLYISKKLLCAIGSELYADKDGNTVTFGFSLPYVGDED